MGVQGFKALDCCRLQMRFDHNEGEQNAHLKDH